MIQLFQHSFDGALETGPGFSGFSGFSGGEVCHHSGDQFQVKELGENLVTTNVQHRQNEFPTLCG